MLKIYVYNDFNESLYKNMKIVVTEYSCVNTFCRYVFTCAVFYNLTRGKEFIFHERLGCIEIY
jgi:hypothetical protein